MRVAQRVKRARRAHRSGAEQAENAARELIAHGSNELIAVAQLERVYLIGPLVSAVLYVAIYVVDCLLG